GLTVVGDGGTPSARSCTTTFKLTAAGASAVGVGGEWNNFTPAMTPMSNDGSGNWSVTLTLAPGSYAYKLVSTSGGMQHWDLDHTTPYTKYVAGIENSVIEVEDCNLPRLDFKTMSKSADGKLHLEATYVDGSGAAGVDAPKSSVLLDGKTVAASI